MTIRIIKHEAVPQTGSFEVRFPNGGPRERKLRLSDVKEIFERMKGKRK